jgi:hypothetical protein
MPVPKSLFDPAFVTSVKVIRRYPVARFNLLPRWVLPYLSHQSGKIRVVSRNSTGHGLDSFIPDSLLSLISSFVG